MNLSILQQRCEKYSALCVRHDVKKLETEISGLGLDIEKNILGETRLKILHFELLADSVSNLTPEQKIKRKRTDANLYALKADRTLLEAEKLEKVFALNALNRDINNQFEQANFYDHFLSEENEAYYGEIAFSHLVKDVSNINTQTQFTVPPSKLPHDAHCQAFKQNRFTVPPSKLPHDAHCQAFKQNKFTVPPSKLPHDAHCQAFKQNKFTVPKAEPEIQKLDKNANLLLLKEEAQIEGVLGLLSSYFEEDNTSLLYLIIEEELFISNNESFQEFIGHDKVQIQKVSDLEKVGEEEIVLLNDNIRVLFILFNEKEAEAARKTREEIDEEIRIKKQTEVPAARKRINYFLKNKPVNQHLLIYVNEVFFKKFSSFQGTEGVRVFHGEGLPNGSEKSLVQFIVNPVKVKSEEDVNIITSYRTYLEARHTELEIAKTESLEKAARQLLGNAYPVEQEILMSGENKIDFEVAYNSEKAVLVLRVKNEESDRPFIVYCINIFDMTEEFECERVDYKVESAARKKMSNYLYPLSEIMEV